MERITKQEYNKIHNDYKGIWSNDSIPEYVGKRTMMKLGNNGTCLLVEGFHFVIAG